jgi:hypothetical protein
MDWQETIGKRIRLGRIKVQTLQMRAKRMEKSAGTVLGFLGLTGSGVAIYAFAADTLPESGIKGKASRVSRGPRKSSSRVIHIAFGDLLA